jgi:hypothetical protein
MPLELAMRMNSCAGLQLTRATVADREAHHDVQQGVLLHPAPPLPTRSKAQSGTLTHSPGAHLMGDLRPLSDLVDRLPLGICFERYDSPERCGPKAVSCCILVRTPGEVEKARALTKVCCTARRIIVVEPNMSL